MKKEKIIGVSIISILLIGVCVMLGVFLYNMVSFQKQLKTALAVDRLSISCDSKYYSNKKDESDTEFELSSVDMYYSKNEDGYYDFKCGNLAVFDNNLYHASIGPYLGSGSRAELTEQEAISVYEEYFVRATRYISDSKFGVPMHNYVAVTKALKEHNPLFITKKKNGSETEYKLYFGKGFYKDIIKYVQGGDLIDFNKPLKFPIVVKFKNNKLVQISIKFNATVEFFISIFNPNKRRGTNYYEYNLYYDYEKEFTVTDNQKQQYPYDFYQKFEPKKAVELSTVYFRDMKFHNGKVYVVADNFVDEKHTLEIYDLKSGSKVKTVDLPKNAYNVFNMVIRGDNIYLRVDPHNEFKVFCYNEKTEQSIIYDLPALQLFFVEDELVVVENGKKISCGKDFNSLVPTNKYDDASWFYYDHYSGNTYAQVEIDEKIYLVKLTKDGFANDKIQLPTNNYEFNFTQEGVVVRHKLKINQYARAIQSKYFKYNGNLEKIDEWEIENYDGDYLGETDDYIFYTSFVVDKKTDKYYGFDVDVYKRYAIFDGILYFNNSSAIFSSETLSVKNNY